MQSSLRIRCLIAFTLAFVADATAAWHVQTLVARDLVPATLTIAALQFINFFGLALAVDSKSFGHRLAVTTATAFGAGAATALVVLFSR